MIVFNETTCILCGMCAKDCPTQVIREENGKMRSADKCLMCGHCVAICPVGAVSIQEYDDQPVEYQKPRFTVEPENMLNSIKFRRSIRKYKPRGVEKEKLLQLIDAGMHTATAGNRQEISYVILQENLEEFKKLVFEEIGKTVTGEKPDWAREKPEHWVMLKRFYKGRNLPPEKETLFRDAPAIIFVLGKEPFDGGLASQNMELLANTLGLGFMYNGYLTRITMMFPKLRDFLGLGERELSMCTLVGYPDVEYHRTAPRKTPEVTWL